MNNTKKLAYLSVLISMASILHVLEGLFPNPFLVPGAKLGLANIVTLITLFSFGFREGMTVALMRVVLGSLVGGTLFSPAFLLSISGSLLSTLVMAFLIEHLQGLTIIGISIVGAAAHNIAQLTTASLLVSTPALLAYLPFLLIFAVPTGLFTGMAANTLKGYNWAVILNR